MMKGQKKIKKQADLPLKPYPATTDFEEKKTNSKDQSKH